MPGWGQKSVEHVDPHSEYSTVLPLEFGQVIMSPTCYQMFSLDGVAVVNRM